MALCNLRLGMIRKAEEYAIDFTKATKLPSGAILLSHIYRKLDQPVAAAKTLSKCIRKYPNDILLLSNLARLDSLRKWLLSCGYFKTYYSYSRFMKVKKEVYTKNLPRIIKKFLNLIRRITKLFVLQPLTSFTITIQFKVFHITGGPYRLAQG